MPLSNPWYLDVAARHRAAQQRLLAYMAVGGQEGVLGSTHLAVKAYDTPGAGITGLPGGYSVLCKHSGGDYEAYVGKITTQNEWGPSGDGTVAVSPTDSSGPRSDLVILRVENPYVSGAGSWSVPGDPIDGPYAYIRVIEDVPDDLTTVVDYNSTWAAIPLARIDRPASTGVVEQEHITDLRGLVDLLSSGMFTAQDNLSVYEELIGTDTTWQDFPAAATWDIPIPAWASHMEFQILGNLYFLDDCWAQFRLTLDGDAVDANPAEVDWNYVADAIGQADMRTMLLAGRHEIDPSLRGTTSPIQVQGQFHGGHTSSSKIMTGQGTYFTVQIIFRRLPTYA